MLAMSGSRTDAEAAGPATPATPSLTVPDKWAIFAFLLQQLRQARHETYIGFILGFVDGEERLRRVIRGRAALEW